MSGIFGYFTLSKVGEKKIANVTNAMKLEEYSIIELIHKDSCILGKLAIKSTRTEQSIKRIKREDGISLVICGEVYNEDIEDIDKYVCSLYRDGRLDLLRNVNGSFAIAVYESDKEKLTIANDRYGLIKLFYYAGKRYFCFAPKIRPLLRLGVNRALRKDAIIDFFLFWYLLGNKTFFKHIYQLPPASILEVSREGMKLTKYWDYEYDEEYDSRAKEELVDEVGALWQRAVERRIDKDEKIIIPLSGGVDSRAVLAAALRCTPKDNIITFTFGEEGSFDFEIGKMVAAKAGVRNVSLGVERGGFEKQYGTSLNDIEGMVDVTPYFAIKGYEGMKNYGGNILSGYIGDFIMGSHMYPEMIKTSLVTDKDYEEAANLIFKKDFLSMYSLSDIKRLFSLAFCKEIVNPISANELKNNSNKNLSNIYFKHFLENHVNNYTYFTVFRYRHLFNYRAPFLDNDLVDFMRKVPPKLRFGQKLYKAMLLSKYPELFRLPTKNSFGLRWDASNIQLFFARVIRLSKVRMNKISNLLVRRSIFQDKAKNYIDYDDLLMRDAEYRDYIERMIEKIKEREYFNKEHIEKIWNLHMRGRKHYSRLLGSLVTFELFLERFCDCLDGE